MFHWDQSPIAFAMQGDSTLNIKGTPCWMWQPGSGTEKRFVTLQLCIRAAGRQIIKPIIIFRGKGIVVPQHEIDELEKLTNIRFYYQQNAWADGDFCLWCLESFKADLKEAGIDEEVLLGLDGLPAQKTAKFLDTATESNIIPMYTPPDCTDVIAPCDHHVFLTLKNMIKAFYRKMSQALRDLWADSRDNGSLCPSNKRIQIAQWVSAAWAEFCVHHEELILKAFTSTGFLMKLDNPGSEIKIDGLPDYPGEGLNPF
jgi:hypothetical protein